ncbi:Uncharacterised protein [Segatella copri]|nr:Uncharacterised protein [Segatella copri]
MTTVATTVTVDDSTLCSAISVHTRIPVEACWQNLETSSVALGLVVVIAGKEVVGVFNLTSTSLLIVREVWLKEHRKCVYSNVLVVCPLSAEHVTYKIPHCWNSILQFNIVRLYVELY